MQNSNTMMQNQYAGENLNSGMQPQSNQFTMQQGNNQMDNANSMMQQGRQTSQGTVDDGSTLR